MASPRTNRSARVDFDISAAMALADTLKQLPIEVQGSVLADMVKEGAKPVVRSIKSFVPVKSGNLKASIGVALRKGKRRSTTAAAYVGPTWGQFQGGKRLKQGQQAKHPDEPARFAHNVEFGHAGRDGSFVQAHPFMRPGTDAAQENCAAMKVVGFQRGLTKALAKVNKKNIKALSKG